MELAEADVYFHYRIERDEDGSYFGVPTEATSEVSDAVYQELQEVRYPVADAIWEYL